MSTAPIEQQAGKPVRRQFEHVMGMPISVALRGRHAASAEGGEAWQSVIEQLREVDRVFSTYREDWTICRLDRGELTLKECPGEVAEVLDLGRVAEQLSDGAFSVVLPDSDGRRRLDPSGVVKGWAAERASHLLAELDETDFCLSAGGDIICHTADADGLPWRIGIEHPHNPQSLIAVVPVRSGAVATSGTAHRGQHIVDPRTGQPVEGVASVTVIGRSLTWADIDATAAYAHGPRAAEWLRTRPDRIALVVWPDATTTLIEGH
jgi:FAD:protein FMN transferase